MLTARAVLARTAAAVLAILLTLATSTTAAQSATGDIQGTVINGAGALVPGVTVTITNANTGAVQETFTDRAGFFAVTQLPAGQYEVQASAQGYATRRQPSFAVHAGQVITLRLELGLAPAPETITVADAPPMVETTRSQVSSIVVSTEVEHLPMRRRDALGLPLIVAGVGVDIGGGLTIAGQHETSNRVLVDGVDRSAPIGSPDWISQEATQGVQVSTSSFAAEYGRATGGVIHVVTKSGSNELKGSAFAFLGSGTSDVAMNEFGGAAGGPIVRDRHLAYAIYDGLRHSTENVVAFAAPWERRRERNALLAKTDHYLSDAHHLAFRYTADTFNGVGLDPLDVYAARDAARAIDRSTHALTSTMRSGFGSSLVNEARVHFGRSRDVGTEGTHSAHATVRQDGTDVLRIGTNAFSSGGATVKRLQVADTLAWVRGAHKVKAGFDVAFDRIVSEVPGHFSGAYVFNTPASFGRGIPSGPGDTFTQAFERAGTPGRTTSPNAGEYSLFAQDEWRLHQEVTINAGLRYDVQTFAQPAAHTPDPQLVAAGIDTSSIPTDRNNIGPRFGFTWTPPATQFVVRGGYGLVYGRTLWPMVATTHAYNGINVQTITVRGASGEPLPAFPGRFATAPSGAAIRPTIVAFDANYQAPRVQQASVGFDWEWMRNTALTVNYLIARADQLPRAVDRNIASPLTATYTLADAAGNATGAVRLDRYAPSAFSSFARVIAYESTAQSRYHGVTVELARRFSQGHQYRVAYTLGRVNDTMPAATILIPESLDDRKFASNPVAPQLAPARTDHRHRFVGSFIYDSNRFAESYSGMVRSLLSDWMLSAIYTAQTGVPFSAYVSGDINGDGNRLNDLAPGTTRNQHRRPAWISLDPRLARSIELKDNMRVTVIWQAFNLLDRANYTTVNETMYWLVDTQLRANPAFGEALGLTEGRAMQLGVRFTF